MRSLQILLLFSVFFMNCEPHFQEEYYEASILPSTQSSASNPPTVCANDTDCVNQGRVLYDERKICFDNWSQGAYTFDRYFCDFGNKIGSFIGFDDRTTLINSGGADVLKVKMPGNEVGPNNSGIVASAMIPSNREYYLSYRVWFDPGYQFTNGFKLPGLCGGTCNTGGFRVTSDTDGWSFRLMGKHQVAPDSTLADGTLFAYVYHANMNQDYGGNMGQIATNVLERGKWHTIKIYVKTNNPCGTESDGEFKVWLDNSPTPLLQKTGIKFTEGTARIDRVLFHAFHGGATNEYKPTQDQYMRFNEIKWWVN